MNIKIIERWKEMKFKRLIVILVGIIIFTLITVIMPATIFAASTTNFSGDLGGLFKRPNFNLTAGSDKYHYFAIGLTPAESGTYSIEVVSTNPAIDTAMFLYDGPFNCAKPTQNLVAANDDGGVGLYLFN